MSQFEVHKGFGGLRKCHSNVQGTKNYIANNGSSASSREY
jgi:hypothetical protein